MAGLGALLKLRLEQWQQLAQLVLMSMVVQVVIGCLQLLAQLLAGLAIVVDPLGEHLLFLTGGVQFAADTVLFFGQPLNVQIERDDLFQQGFCAGLLLLGGSQCFSL